MLEIAQPAMDQLGRCRRRGAGEITHFAEPHRERPPHGVAGDPGAVDAAADHEQIERRVIIPIHGPTIAGVDLRREAVT